MSLTSVIGREPVFSHWYGRRQSKKVRFLSFYSDIRWSKNSPKTVLFALFVAGRHSNVPPLMRQRAPTRLEHVHCGPSRITKQIFWLSLLGLLAKIKCSICSYQLNIWYAVHWAAHILNWFLELGCGKEACLVPATGCLGIALPPSTAHFPSGKITY